MPRTVFCDQPTLIPARKPLSGLSSIARRHRASGTAALHLPLEQSDLEQQSE
jgi:hypothetical protein